MPTHLILPPLGAAREATIERFYKAVGDHVALGDALLVAHTDRFEWDVPATAAGTIDELIVAPGSTVAIGAELATIRMEDHRSSGDQPASVPLATTQAAVDRPPRATPLARRIAATHGLALTTIDGSGRAGIITRADVLAQVEPGSTGAREPGSWGARNAKPETRNQKRETRNAKPETRPPEPVIVSVPSSLILHPSSLPVALTAVEVDLHAVVSYVARERARLARRGVVLTALACIAQAVAATLPEHRALNGVWSDDGPILRAALRLNCVIDGRALVVVDAAERNVAGLARALQPSAPHRGDGVAATFTIVQAASGWSEPAVADGTGAALAVGAIRSQPVVRATDEIVIRPVTILTLAYDARICDQAGADAFLMALKRRLEHFQPL